MAALPSRHDGDHALAGVIPTAPPRRFASGGLVDRQGYSPQISRAGGFLHEMRKGGAFRYRPDSDDMNTWATMFAVQALRWADGGGDWQWMV
jgi:hypothetical protein